MNTQIYKDGTEVAPFFAVAEGDIIESPILNIAYGANTVAFPQNGGTMRRFSKHFEGLSKEYAKACLDGSMEIGGVFIFHDSAGMKTVFALGIQSIPGPFASLKFITQALEQTLQIVRDDEVLDNELAIPAIGCGRGGLTWKQVEPVVKELAEKYQIKVTAYLA